MNSDTLNWYESDMTYRCQLGEINIFNFTTKGFKVSPNIFELPQQTPQPYSDDKGKVSYAYSLPCAETLKPGLTMANGYITHILNTYKHLYVDTSGDWEEYLTRFKGKTLNTLKRKIKKVEKSNNEVSDGIRIFKHENEISEFLSIAKSISVKSYQERLLGRSLPIDSDFEEKLKDLAKNNSFRGYILYAEDTPIAYNLCPIYGNGVKLYDFTGYDPDYGKYSAGTVLQYKIIEECFKDPEVKIYDLCTGEGQHKDFFATGYKNCCDAYYFPITVKYLIITLIKRGFDKLSRLLVNILDKFDLKEKIKKLIRRAK